MYGIQANMSNAVKRRRYGWETDKLREALQRQNKHQLLDGCNWYLQSVSTNGDFQSMNFYLDSSKKYLPPLNNLVKKKAQRCSTEWKSYNPGIPSDNTPEDHHSARTLHYHPCPSAGNSTPASEYSGNWTATILIRYCSDIVSVAGGKPTTKYENDSQIQNRVNEWEGKPTSSPLSQRDIDVRREESDTLTQNRLWLKWTKKGMFCIKGTFTWSYFNMIIFYMNLKGIPVQWSERQGPQVCQVVGKA